MKIKTLLIIAFICFAARTAIPSDIDLLMADSSISGALVGVMVQDINNDSVIFAHDATMRFTPASNLKLFTIAAALEFLGPGYQFETSFLTTSRVSKKGIVNGDLIIVGGGDPLISGRFRKDNTEIFELWADSLKARGIKQIKGNLVIDNTFFENDELGRGWSHDDLSYWYACPISALSYNDNCVDLHVYPGKEIGAKCRVILNPATNYIDTTNKTITLPAGSPATFDYDRQMSTNKVSFFGGIALDDTSGIVDYVSVKDPHKYCAHVFRNVLARNQIKLDGKIRDISPRQKLLSGIRREYRHLFDWRSDSLGVVLAVIGKNSQNFFAEQMLKTIGAVVSGTGSFPIAAQIVSNWLEKIGINSDDINYVDGSGLSYINMTKPSAVIQLLNYMHKSSNFPIFYESLAIPVKDKSVRDRLVGHPLAEKMRVKTGYMANVSTFSGYLTTKTGRLFAFSIMVNHFSSATTDITSWQDKVCAYFIDNY